MVPLSTYRWRRVAVCFVFLAAAAPATQERLPDSKLPPIDRGDQTRDEVTAPERSRGELLYENHCTSCHESRVHVRENRRANSVAAVAGWVRRWSNELKLDWGDEEIAEVTRHLVRRYYKFDAPAPRRPGAAHRDELGYSGTEMTQEDWEVPLREAGVPAVESETEKEERHTCIPGFNFI